MLCSYQKIISAKIIFNNTGYLILMLGAVGYSPVVSPHRIKQVCKPYRVVKVAAEWYSVGSLDQWSLVSWQNCYDTVVFSLVLCIQLWVQYSVLQRANHRSTPCIALMSGHRRRSMHWHKGKCNKKKMPSQYQSSSRKKALTWHLYPKGIESLIGHQKFVRGSVDTFASEPVV